MPFVEKSHLCKFSLEEAQLISGKKDLNEACDVLHKAGTKIITVTLGKDGTLLSMNGSKKVIPSVPVNPVDTTGAGDAFIGCLLYQISDLGNFESVFEDFSLVENMVATANKAGAITTTNYGAIVALPTKDQLEK